MAYPYNYQPNYQNYFPVGYQPVQQNYQQPTMQQPVQQPQQSYSPAINQSGIIWISGLQEAQMFPVGPNSAAALWQKDGKTIYLKQADATGRPTLTVYDLVERTETPQDSGNNGDNKSPNFATKDELSAVVNAIKGYAETISSMKSDVDSLKTDFYGIQGRKRVVKKQDVEADE